MNKENCITLNLAPVREGDPPKSYNTVITLSAYSEKHIGYVLRQAYEIPILQGELVPQPDGGMEYRMNLTQEQAEPLIRAINEITFRSSQSLN